MKEFKFEALPEELQDLILEFSGSHGLFSIVGFDEELNAFGEVEFKVQPAADPEWGNGHVPLAVYLVKHGANKGETVKITGI